MPEPDLYEDPRLAALYDLFSPPGADTAFYRRLAGRRPLEVLDLGCGTGQLALALAEDGHRVTGVDPAPAMLAVARARNGAGSVRWVEAAAGDFQLGRRFDLAVMTGHAFQVLLSDAEIRAALATVRRHLKPGGRFAFESRNPAAREWESWTPALSAEVLALPDGSEVELHNDATPLEGECLTYGTYFHFRSTGERLATRNALRFAPQHTIAGLLAAAGFDPVTWYGDWQGRPLAPESPEIIAVATAA